MNKRVLFAAALAALAASPLSGLGLLMPGDVPLPGMPVVMPPDWGDDVALEELRVTGSIDDARVRLVYEERFVNRGSGLAEGSFVWPIPRGFNVVSLTLGDGTTFLEGEVYDAGEAQAIYEEIVRRQRDPALLQLVGQGLLSVRAFPIPAGEARTVRVEIEGQVERLGTLRSLRLPLTGQGRGEAERVVVDLEVAASYELRTLSSPTPGASARLEGPRSGRVLFARETESGPGDLHVLYSARAGDLNLDVVTRVEDDEIPGGEGAGTFYLSLSGLPDASDVGAKAFALVLDVSGSMGGEKIAQAVAAARFVIDRLRPEDTFDLVAFSTAEESAFGGLVPATPENVAAAHAFLDRQEALGGTNYEAALGALTGLSWPEGVPGYAIFLTDGLPTVGDTSEAGLLARVADERGWRLFVFGVGDDVNIPFLDTLSTERRGRGAYVAPGEDLEVPLGAFYTAIGDPVLSDLEIEIDGVEAFAVLPATLPDLFAGTDLIVSGRYTGGSPVTVKVRGTRGGELIEREFLVEFGDGGRRADFVPRLWAGRQIGRWLDEIRRNGEDPELVESITALSKRYGILTPYTSYLALEEAFRGAADAPLMTLDAGDQFGRVMASPAPAAREASQVIDDLREGKDLDEFEAALEEAGVEVRRAGGRAFVLVDGEWRDLAYDPDDHRPATMETYSEEWFDLAGEAEELREMLALGERVVLKWGGAWYRTGPS